MVWNSKELDYESCSRERFLSHHDLELVQSETKGRGLVFRASTSERGQLIFKERPYARIVLSPHQHDICSVCFQAADPDCICDDCNQVSFCSETCQDLVNNGLHGMGIHALECTALEEIDRIARTCDVSPDILRLILRIYAQRAISGLPNGPNCQPNSLNCQPNGPTSSFHDVLCLTEALAEQSPAWLAAMAKAAGKLIEMCPPIITSVDEVVSLAARINENAHALGTAESPEQVLTLGLFPFASLMNHSCDPSCVWSTDDSGNLQIRALGLTAGQECTISYLPPGLPRHERLRLLKTTKHFDCACSRCAEPLEDSTDLDISEASSSNLVHEFTKINTQVKEWMEQKQFQKALNELEEWFHRTPELHADHYLRFAMTEQSARCCTALCQLDKAVQYWRQVIAMTKRTHSDISVVQSQYYYDFGEALRRYRQVSDEKEKLVSEQRQAWTQCLAIRQICFGPLALSTIKLQQQLDALT